MKYITYTFTLLLIGSLLPINTYAQEKQNDATWEETVEFIESHKQHFLKVQARIPFQPVTEFEITGTNLVVEARGSVSGNIEADLVYIRSVSAYPRSKRLEIIFSDNIILTELLTGVNSGKMRTNKVLLFDISSVSMLERLEKAFKQLAYLAEEKRQQSKF